MIFGLLGSMTTETTWIPEQAKCWEYKMNELQKITVDLNKPVRFSVIIISRALASQRQSSTPPFFFFFFKRIYVIHSILWLHSALIVIFQFFFIRYNFF